MQAIILAAGMGKRLKQLTHDNTKCMVKVNGVTLIERALKQLQANNLSRVIIVDGYQADGLEAYVKSLDISIPIVFIRNDDYATTNNIFSLALAKDYLCQEDTLLLESDLIFEDAVLDALLNDPEETIALVDKYESWMDGTCVKLDDAGEIVAFVPGKKFLYEDIHAYYKTVNIYKFSKEFSKNCYVPFLDAYVKTLGNNEYYEQVLRVITMLDEPQIKAKKLNGQLWYEIDDIQDLDIAESMFIDDENKVSAIQKRFGGYWRYPKMHDFCYAGNSYYPPKKMADELRFNLDRVMTSYPSGNRVNSLLVAKDMGVRIDQVAVSNGLEELIKTLLYQLPKDRVIGVVKPINEEYIRRLSKYQVIEYDSIRDDFHVRTDEIIDFFDAKGIHVLLISNPNTHTGDYIGRTEVIRLLDWAKNKGIQVLLDESYIDFATEENASVVEQEIYEQYENLIILRNLSASQGLFGLRIGCAISSDTELIKQICDDLALWNINSVAEFYLQIMEKYKKDYQASLASVRKAREELKRDLDGIEGLEPLPSETNYITCEITADDIDAKQLTQTLLLRYNILVKDLSDRIASDRQFIRIAIRDAAENRVLVNALQGIFSGGRLKGVACDIDERRTKDFFDNRTDKKLPHRYNYVIYQDNNPELALERDRYEKDKMLPHLLKGSQIRVLDIGCGVGRWGDEFVQHEELERYVGIDYSQGLLDVAKENLGKDARCKLLCGRFQDVSDLLKHHDLPDQYDAILINGVLMYLNDADLEECMQQAAKLLKKGGRVYIKESVGRDQRFTLMDFYSKEFAHNYNAIYRGIKEYQGLIDRLLLKNGFTVVDEGETWPQAMENRSETTSYYWIIEK